MSFLDVDETYPTYHLSVERINPGQVEVDVPADLVERYNAAQEAFLAAREEVRNVLDPRCPECTHRQSRHQQWSKGWDTWGCLDRANPGTIFEKSCRCQHGMPQAV